MSIDVDPQNIFEVCITVEFLSHCVICVGVHAEVIEIADFNDARATMRTRNRLVRPIQGTYEK
jgi:hypothetical protein